MRRKFLNTLQINKSGPSEYYQDTEVKHAENQNELKSKETCVFEELNVQLYKDLAEF